MTRTKKLLLAAPLLVIAVAALADWRDWIDSPDLLSHRYKRFDRFEIEGDAPFCMLLDSESDFLDCHFLSEQHCVIANKPLTLASEPADRALCVPNPLP